MSYDDSRERWFTLIDQVLPLCRAAARFVIMPCCGIDRLGWWYANHKPMWVICWHKGSPGHRSFIGFNDWEAHLVWGKPPKQMHDYFSMACGFDDNGHPCPKPVEYATWLVQRAAEKDGTVIDPFMGSGTTGVACLRLGRKFVGIEISEKYFDIACRRIDKQYRSGDFMKSSKPKSRQSRLV